MGRIPYELLCVCKRVGHKRVEYLANTFFLTRYTKQSEVKCYVLYLSLETEIYSMDTEIYVLGYPQNYFCIKDTILYLLNLIF